MGILDQTTTLNWCFRPVTNQTHDTVKKQFLTLPLCLVLYPKIYATPLLSLAFGEASPTPTTSH